MPDHVENRSTRRNHDNINVGGLNELYTKNHET